MINNMNKRFERILSFVLALVMVVGMLPGGIFDIKATAADSDWYWEGDVLHVNPKTINNTNLYDMLARRTDKFGTPNPTKYQELNLGFWKGFAGGYKLTASGATTIYVGSNNTGVDVSTLKDGATYTVYPCVKKSNTKYEYNTAKGSFTVKFDSDVKQPVIQSATVHMNGDKLASEQVATLKAAIIAGVVKDHGDYAAVTPTVYVYDGGTVDYGWQKLEWYKGGALNDEIYADNGNRQVRLVWPATGDLPACTLETIVKFADLRTALNLTANYTGGTIFVNGNVDSTVYAAALGAITGAPAGVTPTYTYKDVTLSATDPTNVEVTVTFAKSEVHTNYPYGYLESSIVVTIPVQLNTQPSNITVNNDGNKGSYTLTDANGHAVSGSAGAGKLTITVTPAAGGHYVDSVTVKDKNGNTVAVSGSWKATVYTATFDVANNNEYTVTVTYGTRTLTPIAKPDGQDYHVATINGHNKDTILNGLKNNIIKSVLGNVDNISQYTVEIYVDLGVWKGWVNPEDASILNTVSDWLTKLNMDFWLEVPGREKVRITLAGSDKYQTQVWEGHVDIADSRQAANVSLGSFEKKQNTLDDFKTAILNAINVTNSANANIKPNAGLTITLNPVEGKVNTYTVSWTVANSGETWLATSGTFAGEVVWEVKIYNVTFKNDDGSVLSEKTYPYGTTADQIEVPTTPTKANEVDANGNIIARYTFAGWNPTVDTVTGEAVYTATYNRVVEKYTVTFVDGNGNTVLSTEVEYGATPEYTGATPTKTATAQYSYTFKGWDKEIVAVTGAATYTAQFDSTVNKYTISKM